MTLHAHPRPLKLALTLMACATLTVVVPAGVATPAQAADRCNTPGHAYLTKPGRIYFSGYNGDGGLGVPTFHTFRGDTFRLGGNGVLPGTPIRFQAVNVDTGAQINFYRGQSLYTTRGAGDNCVVNEEGPLTVTAPSGTYRVTALYDPGNTPPTPGDIVDQVVNVVVS
ncbi:hypothetical protein [Streptomyces sp. NBC_00035]|uniref:hypothetical protein n=1 Tax=Streptomyces sp. NBC_00035 TaxID=2903614 RepID=UPI0032527B3D